MENKISMALWKTLFEYARDFLNRAPWKTYYDSDAFGIADTESGETVYCVVLGAGREVYGLNFYIGKAGLDGYQEMGRGKDKSEKVFKKQNLIWLHFEKDEFLPPEDKKTAVISGMDFKKEIGWPTFARMSPGFMPYEISVKDAELIVRIFPRFLEMLERYKDTPEKLRPEKNACLVSALENGKWKEKLVRWDKNGGKNTEDELPDNIIQIPTGLKIGKDVRKTQTVWEVELFAEMEPLKSDEKKRVFFPVLGIAVDEESCFVLNTEIMGPDEKRAVLSFIEKTVNKNGFYPSVIKVRSAEAEEELKASCERRGIKVIRVKSLPAAAEIIRSMKKAGVLKTMGRPGPGAKRGPGKSPRFFPELEHNKDCYYLKYPDEAGKIIPAQDKFFEYIEQEDWENAEKAGFSLIRKAACQFDVYNVLSDYYMEEGNIDKLLEIHTKALEDYQYVLDRLPRNAKLEWAHTGNRPFLRYMEKLGFVLFDEMDYMACREVFETLIRLNPEDNQGVRQILPAVYFELTEYNMVLNLAERYPGDDFPELHFGKVIAFLKLGRKDEAEKTLRKAAVNHPKIIKELLKKSHRRPAGYEEGYITMGGSDQAYGYNEFYGKYWRETPEAMELLEELRKP